MEIGPGNYILNDFGQTVAEIFFVPSLHALQDDLEKCVRELGASNLRASKSAVRVGAKIIRPGRQKHLVGTKSCT